jgi:hypothetical protein
MVLLLMAVRDEKINVRYSSVAKLCYVANAHDTPFLFSSLANE